MVLTDEQQRCAIASPDTHVSLVGERGDALGVALQLAPLHLGSHVSIHVIGARPTADLCDGTAAAHRGRYGHGARSVSDGVWPNFCR